jgi:hypothetical protein
MARDFTKKILVSFNHGVALMLDGRAIFVGAAVCEELFQAQTHVGPREKISAKKALKETEKIALDFPMMLRVISLADGKLLKSPIEIMVKWNNISAICSLTETDLHNEA